MIHLTKQEKLQGRRIIATYNYVKSKQRKRVVKSVVVWALITLALIAGWQFCWTMADSDIGWLLLLKFVLGGFMIVLIFGVGEVLENISQLKKLEAEKQRACVAHLKNIQRLRF